MATFSIKPANMKTTPSGTLTVVALVGLALATVITLRAIAQSPTSAADGDVDKFVLIMKNKDGEYHSLKKSTPAGEAEFIMLLCDTQNHHFEQSRTLYFKPKDANAKVFDLPRECNAARSVASPGAQLNIKTDKVTVADAAQRVVDGDPQVTIRVASTSPDDIKAVLDSLAPTP